MNKKPRSDEPIAASAISELVANIITVTLIN